MSEIYAVIAWTPKDQGGRSVLPTGLGPPPFYSPEIRFTDDGEGWPSSDAWSLVVKKDEALSEPSRWIAEVYFRVAEAPHHLLRPGRRFGLYEGNRCVAIGEILPKMTA